MRNVIKDFLRIILLGSLVFLGLLVAHEVHKVYQNITFEANEVAQKKTVPFVHQMMIYDNGELIGTGTGFDVEYKGKVYLMTNKHICRTQDAINGSQEGAKVTMIMKQDHQVKVGKEQSYRKILKISEEHDLCLLESYNKKGIKIAYSGVNLHDHVTVTGHPKGLPLTVRHGNLTSKGASVFPWASSEVINYEMLSIIAYGGNSGSPITNKRGELVGVLFAGPRDGHIETLTVPLIDVKIFLSMFELGR